MGDFFAFWTGERVGAFYPGGNRWVVQCGRGQYDPPRRNAAFSRNTGIAVNFAVRGHDDQIDDYEFCVIWAPAGWRLMFHLDPTRENWPAHPRFHLQMQAPQQPAAPPFADWRIPLCEPDPNRILEFIVSRIR